MGQEIDSLGISGKIKKNRPIIREDLKKASNQLSGWVAKREKGRMEKEKSEDKSTDAKQSETSEENSTRYYSANSDYDRPPVFDNSNTIRSAPQSHPSVSANAIDAEPAFATPPSTENAVTPTETIAATTTTLDSEIREGRGDDSILGGEADDELLDNGVYQHKNKYTEWDDEVVVPPITTLPIDSTPVIDHTKTESLEKEIKKVKKEKEDKLSKISWFKRMLPFGEAARIKKEFDKKIRDLNDKRLLAKRNIKGGKVDSFERRGRVKAVLQDGIGGQRLINKFERQSSKDIKSGGDGTEVLKKLNEGLEQRLFEKIIKREKRAENLENIKKYLPDLKGRWSRFKNGISNQWNEVSDKFKLLSNGQKAGYLALIVAGVGLGIFGAATLAPLFATSGLAYSAAAGGIAGGISNTARGMAKNYLNKEKMTKGLKDNLVKGVGYGAIGGTIFGALTSWLFPVENVDYRDMSKLLGSDKLQSDLATHSQVDSAVSADIEVNNTKVSTESGSSSDVSASTQKGGVRKPGNVLTETLPLPDNSIEIISGEKSLWSIMEDKLEMSPTDAFYAHKDSAGALAEMVIEQAKEQGFSEKIISQLERTADNLIDSSNITGKERFWRVIPDGLKIDLSKLDSII